MKFIKKFNENNSHPILNIVSDIKSMLHDISDDFKTEFEWSSDGIDADHEIIVSIYTKEFANKEDYGIFYNQPGKTYNLLSFFDVLNTNQKNIDQLLNYHKDMLTIYENITIFLERLEKEYNDCYYKVEQKNENKSIIKIKIYISKDETK